MKNKIQGFTLIELMIAIAVGLIVSAAITTMFVAMSNSNVDFLKSTRLNQELRTALGLMARDVRRAGLNRAAANDATTNPFSTTGTTVLTLSNQDLVDPTRFRTINFSYDAADDASIETYGYNFGSTIVNGVAIGTAEYCDGTTNPCSDWEDITDPDVVEVDELTFFEDAVTEGLITLRQVTIRLTGHLRSDPVFTRTLSETVKIRNEHSTEW